MKAFITVLIIAIGFNNNLLAQSDWTNTGTIVVQDASMIGLIVDTGRYNNKLVQVEGYLNLEGEKAVIYMHKEDYDNRLTKNAARVGFSAQIKKEKKLADYNNRYVTIIGLFEIGSSGFCGEINNVISLDNWPPNK